MGFNRPPGDSMDWYQVLEACRTIDRKTPFRASELQLVADFGSTEVFEKIHGINKKISGSSGLQRASSWCTKLVQMGLLKDMGQIPLIKDPDTGLEKHEKPGRVAHLYSVSERGWELKKKPTSRLDRLLAAVRQLQTATEKPQELKFLRELFAVAKEIEDDLAVENKKAGDR